MKALVIRVVRCIALAVVIASTIRNFWDVSTSFGGMVPREADNVVELEKLYVPIRIALREERYFSGDIAYASVRILKGEPINGRDNNHWARLRYASIPLNLIQDLRNVPYVIGDFTDGTAIPEALDGFVKISDPGAGLVLYKRKATP